MLLYFFQRTRNWRIASDCLTIATRTYARSLCMNSLVMKSQAPNEIRSLFGIAFELYSVPTLNGFHTVAFPQLTSGLVWFPTFLQVVPFVVLSCYSQTTIQTYIFNLIIHHSQGFTTIAGLLPFGLVCNLTFNSKICNV